METLTWQEKDIKGAFKFNLRVFLAYQKSTQKNGIFLKLRAILLVMHVRTEVKEMKESKGEVQARIFDLGHSSRVRDMMLPSGGPVSSWIQLLVLVLLLRRRRSIVVISIEIIIKNRFSFSSKSTPKPLLLLCFLHCFHWCVLVIIGLVRFLLLQ